MKEFSCYWEKGKISKKLLLLAVNSERKWVCVTPYGQCILDKCFRLTNQDIMYTLLSQTSSFDKKIAFTPHVMKLRKKLDKALNILKILSNTSWGASGTSLLRVYRATILSKIDYDCMIYGSARQSVLKRLDPIHHSALRLRVELFAPHQLKVFLKNLIEAPAANVFSARNLRCASSLSIGILRNPTLMQYKKEQ
ncbi:hypothetical protein AVEN_168766-1 [Araneus ventricosus]|uniref:Uncharacterized protein n=1 Tax=Araneus ventricosus TaxID=182803 RepID=A0A4Y2GCQ2_ARAVE|nr:hypothetical protein AVEN_168766-1 [Araneus ventricosus]